MPQELVTVAIVVKNYDEALDFYVNKLSFVLVEDTALSETKRWVVVAPPGGEGCKILLAQAANDRQSSAVGNQTGGRVGFFLHTDDCLRDCKNLESKNVKFIREPETQPWGVVAVFEDLYGNLWDLIEPRNSEK